MIAIRPIGFIHSPYKTTDQIPIQGRFDTTIEAYVELKPEYTPGIKDLDGFSHAILLFHFHKSTKEHLQAKPYLEDTLRGIFAIRSPNRPNHLGLTVVKINKIINNRLYFTHVDMIDQTPVIDIKPYIHHFDHREHVRSGWLEKHFQNGEYPKNLTTPVDDK
jgi:tRNA-Thr(GGU) m(6)t(6)A37 methyltransferase TsaA